MNGADIQAFVAERLKQVDDLRGMEESLGLRAHEKGFEPQNATPIKWKPEGVNKIQEASSLQAPPQRSWPSYETKFPSDNSVCAMPPSASSDTGVWGRGSATPTINSDPWPRPANSETEHATPPSLEETNWDHNGAYRSFVNMVENSSRLSTPPSNAHGKGKGSGKGNAYASGKGNGQGKGTGRGKGNGNAWAPAYAKPWQNSKQVNPVEVSEPPKNILLHRQLRPRLPPPALAGHIARQAPRVCTPPIMYLAMGRGKGKEKVLLTPAKPLLDV